jgi:CheY-like chemotaxis protein
VEDHADTAEAMAELLKGLGYQVTVAATVAGGLEAAERAGEDGGRIDLVVSDLGLPDGSGLDLMRLLSQRYGLRGIALSGYGMEDDLQKSREAGFEKHVTKPVSLQTLQAVLQETLGTGFA